MFNQLLWPNCSRALRTSRHLEPFSALTQPAAQPNNFPFCFPASLHCYAPVFLLQEVVDCAEVYVTCCEIAYISSMPKVIGSISDGLLCFFFFDCFLVPPSIMRVVFSTCSRYYHQLWILPPGWWLYIHAIQHSLLQLKRFPCEITDFSLLFCLLATLKDSRAWIQYSAFTNGTFFILCLIMQSSFYPNSLKMDLNSLIRQFQNVGPEFEVLRNWYWHLMHVIMSRADEPFYRLSDKLSCHMK